MTALHANFLLRNQQEFQRLVGLSKPHQHSSNAPPLSSSTGKSWSKSSQFGGTTFLDVNARDNLGRTVLHLAVSCPAADAGALEYVKILLSHPKIDINAADVESRWTPLHRALYQGNLPAAVLLFQRADIDTSLKDYEGYRALDVFNATVEGTKPSISQPRDLYTWGTNRNANLGTSDADGRACPDYVRIKSLSTTSENASPKSLPLTLRFSPARVLDVSMSSLHTAVITEETTIKKSEKSPSTPSSTRSLRLCGIGSGGRLGSVSQHTHYTLSPLPETQMRNEAPIHSVALGTDHTLILTEDGVVLSFGSNRFAQLGYVIDSSGSGPGPGVSGSGGQAQQIQTIPRRIGSLKKESVKGIAACRMASACWTTKELFTWGTNTGQLGYDKTAQPVQIQPRRVPQLTQPILDIALSDLAMCILIVSQDVICLWGGRSFKINFTASPFPPRILAYRPPMSQKTASIAKIVSCDNTFAALSSLGEIFTFSLSHPSEAASPHKGPNNTTNVSASTLVKPQRVWTLQKQFSAVRDVALGSDGTIVLCTEAGHVYVRQRLGKGLNFKFSKVNGLQRVVRVAASESGAFAALRAECSPLPIKIPTAVLQTDLARLRPWHVISCPNQYKLEPSRSESEEKEAGGTVGAPEDSDSNSVEDDESDNAILEGLQELNFLLDILELDGERRKVEGKGLYDHNTSSTSDAPTPLPGHWRLGGGAHGADLLVRVGKARAFEFPIHSMLFSARSDLIGGLLEHKGSLRGEALNSEITVACDTPPEDLGILKDGRRPVQAILITGVHPLSVLTLSHYLYTDTFPSILDRRVTDGISDRLRSLPPTSVYEGKRKELKPVSAEQIRAEIRALAILLQLDALSEAAEHPYRHFCEPRLARDLKKAFVTLDSAAVNDTTTGKKAAAGPDVVLRLADNTVKAHSVILRARSPYFASFFDEPVWTEMRWSPEGLLYMDLQHIHDKVMRYVVRWMYEDSQEELFEKLEFCESIDDALSFLFEIITVASELLLDPLILICSSVILKFVNIHNACSILADAHYYNAHALVNSLYGYLSLNLETLLEAHALDDIPLPIVQELAHYVRERQAEKLSLTRSGILEAKAMERWAEWIACHKGFTESIGPVPSEQSRTIRAGERTGLNPRISPLAATQENSDGSVPTPGEAREATFVVPTSVPPTPLPALTNEANHDRGIDVLHAEDIFTMDQEEALPLDSPATSSTAPSTQHRPVTPTSTQQGASTSTTTSPWKNRALQQPGAKVDLRTIMAEAETSRNIEAKSIPAPPTPSRNSLSARPAYGGTGRTPPNGPKLGALQQKVHAVSALDKTNGPWRQIPSNIVPSAQKPTPSVAGQSQFSGLSRAMQSQAQVNSSSATHRSFSQPHSSPGSSQADEKGKGKVTDASTIGLTYSPSKKPVGSNAPVISAVPMSRRVSDGNGNPWTLAPPAFPSSPHTQTRDNASSSPPSFLAIQKQQLQSVNSTKQKKSLLEIQDEERTRKAQEEEAAQARLVEEEFMRWWTAEEERIRRETQAVPGPPVGIIRGKEGGGKKSHGRGRGKGKTRDEGHDEQVPTAGSGQARAKPEQHEHFRDGNQPSRALQPRGRRNPRPPSDGQPQQT